MQPLRELGVLGWINYYGVFYRSELYSLALRIDQHLVRWAMQKFKRLRRNPPGAWAWLNAARQQIPDSSLTGTFSRSPPTDLQGGDELRGSRLVL